MNKSSGGGWDKLESEGFGLFAQSVRVDLRGSHVNARRVGFDTLQDQTLSIRLLSLLSSHLVSWELRRGPGCVCG